MSLESLQTEIKQVDQTSVRSIEQFFDRHPLLFAFCHIYLGGQWLLRACLWTLLLLVAVVGLKVLWLAVLYMWRLV